MARLIKRYENRKLYDTEQSAYVSLADIAQMVRAGGTVEVIDNASGNDLTAQTLTQIILEEGKQGRSALPADMLHDLVRRSSQALDSGLEQIRHGVDDLFQSSISRLSQFMHASKPGELQQLRDQLAHLEQLLTRILEEKQQENK
jgi:polyhydroxyalkanoate synthesis repressor PhaR